MKVHFGFVVVLAFLAAACSQQPPATVSKPDLAKEEAAIRDADAQWAKAVQERNVEVAAALFAADGRAYHEHAEPSVGPAAIQAWTAKNMAENPKMAVTWETDSIEVAESGDLAVQVGKYHVAGLGPQGEGKDEGRFVTVWKKIGGEWKVAHDIGLTTMPEPPPAKTP